MRAGRHDEARNTKPVTIPSLPPRTGPIPMAQVSDGSILGEVLDVGETATSSRG